MKINYHEYLNTTKKKKEKNNLMPTKFIILN